jgi:hypothetical protein
VRAEERGSAACGLCKGLSVHARALLGACVCACACVRVCDEVCVRAFACAWVRVCACACACVTVCARVCVCVSVRVCVCRAQAEAEIEKQAALLSARAEEIVMLRIRLSPPQSHLRHSHLRHSRLGTFPLRHIPTSPYFRLGSFLLRLVPAWARTRRSIVLRIPPNSAPAPVATCCVARVHVGPRHATRCVATRAIRCNAGNAEAEGRNSTEMARLRAEVECEKLRTEMQWRMRIQAGAGAGRRHGCCCCAEWMEAFFFLFWLRFARFGRVPSDGRHAMQYRYVYI